MSSKAGVASHADLKASSLFNMKGRVALVTGSEPSGSLAPNGY